MKLNLRLLLFFLIAVLLSLALIGGDTLYLLVWWVAILAIGLIFLPITSKAFSKFFDKGYLFSKTIGLALSTFILWFLSSLKIVPFYAASAFIILGIAFLVFYIVLKGYKTISSLFCDINCKKIFVFEELGFLLLLVLFAFLRGHTPSFGMELPMDFAFLNNLLNTKFMPPVDMWYAGVQANYYYYGQYIFAFLTKITDVDSTITYNLGMCTLFAFGFSLTFSLTANLVYLLGKKQIKSIIAAGLISACILAFGGTLHTIVHDVGVPAAKAVGIYNGKVNDYYFTEARSYLGFAQGQNDQAITEFPAYSFALGDLHAQIIDIIFVLTFLALLFALLAYFINRIKIGEFSKWYHLPLENLLILLLLPVMFMTNAWDYPIYVVVAGAIFLSGIVIISQKHASEGYKSILVLVADFLVLIVASLILLIPFLAGFTNPTQGVHISKLSHLLSITYLSQFAVTWGYQVFFAVLFMIFLFRTEPRYFHQLSLSSRNKSLNKSNKLKNKNQKNNSALNKTETNLENKINLGALKGKVGFIGSLKKFLSEASPSDIFVLVLTICALGLILISETIYQKDVSGDTSYRSNTVWKVGLQAFIMFDIAIGYIIVRVLAVKNYFKNRALLIGIISFILFSVMLYPYYSLRQPYTGDYKNLNVLNILKTQYPDDYNVIIQMRNSIKGQPVVLESNGFSYWNIGDNKDTNRISIGTGFPTILGWYTHQQYWRGEKNYSELEARDKEVQTVYTSPDSNAVNVILKKYKVEYIVIGKLERDKYGANLKEATLLNLGKVAFTSGETKVIKLAGK